MAMAMTGMAAAFLPNRVVSRRTVGLIAVGQAGLLLLLWLSAPPVVFPKPAEVLAALGELWWIHGLGRALGVSLRTTLEALLLSAGLGLLLSYATVLPAFRPLSALVSKGRFLGMAGLTFAFTLALGGGHGLKVALLTFGMTVFFVTAMSAVVAAIPREQFDHARTLGMGEGRMIWEVVVLGTADEALELLRQNAAVGWTMLTMVEGLVRAEGGVGTLLLDQGKHFHLAQVLALQLAILAVGIFLDYALGLLRQALCPHADLQRERR